jgi:hypothetical protein
MRGKGTWITLVSLAAVVAVGVVAYRFVSTPRTDACQICERPLHYGVHYQLVLEDGTRETACCARCGMHLMIERPGEVKETWATDLPSGERISAEAAWYVEGGDEEFCTLHSTPVVREPAGVARRAYDRCLPQLVAFRARDQAQAYQAEHGGRVLDYEHALESVKAR